MAVDADGRLLVANPGLGYVWVLNHRAEPEQVLRGAPGSSTTNLGFGGAHRKQLFVTDSTHGRILTTTLDAAGLVLHRGPSDERRTSSWPAAHRIKPVYNCECVPAMSGVGRQCCGPLIEYSTDNNRGGWQAVTVDC